MGKITYHIYKNKKNLCGMISDNAISQGNRTLKEIKEIINNNKKFIQLCKKCKQIMENEK